MSTDYVLGTHAAELERLGLQHRVWRSVVLAAWHRAGLTTGQRVLDIGAGPGYATADLAEIVGPSGKVVALERSPQFVEAIRAGRLANVEAHQLDLMEQQWPGGDYDFAWCRWVTAFVENPGALIAKLASAMRPGGVAVFHEYGYYETWQFLPPDPAHEEFRRQVVKAWRASGGEPNVGAELPVLLERHGFVVRSVRPHVFCLRPTDYMWQWPATFIDVYAPRLKEENGLDDSFVDNVRAALRAAEAEQRWMMTPLVVEIMAEKAA
jgi:SAM-dependent methyltransferase